MQLNDQKSSKESYRDLMSKTSKSFLIDVRSNKELFDVGVADFSEKPEALVFCEWRYYPSMELNLNFFDELNRKLNLAEVEALYFLCAAGIRSQEAATFMSNRVKELNLSIKCINVSDGFNGNKKAYLGFGKASGWKAVGLPCCQVKKP